MKLLVSQKNELFDILQYYNLPIRQFVFKEKTNANNAEVIITVLEFSQSNFYFAFDTYTGSNMSPYYCKYSPGDSLISVDIYTGSWEKTIAEFYSWAESLKREISIVNKWERLQDEYENFKIQFTDNNNDKFTASEFLELKSNISQLKIGLETLQLLPKEVSTIRNSLDHLIILAENMNKFDWKNLFIGTIISIIIQLSVTTENAKNLFNLIKSIFKNLLLN